MIGNLLAELVCTTMKWHSVLLATSVLTAGTQAYAPIRWMKAPSSGLTLMPKGFRGTSRELSPPQALTIGMANPLSPSMVPYFTAKTDSTIIWDTMDWCVEASGRKSGDAVRVNECNGEATQKWNWIPDGHGRNIIQLKNSDQCVVVTSSSIGAPVELQRCERQMTDTWKLEEFSPLPTRVPAHSFLSNMRHLTVALIAMVGLGLLSLGAWFWRPAVKSNMVAATLGGVSMPVHEISGSRSGDVGPMATVRRTGNIIMMADRFNQAEDRMVRSPEAATTEEAQHVLLHQAGKSKDPLGVSFSRRQAIGLGMGLGAMGVGLSSPSVALAAAEAEEDVEVYFGCGCFWHVQHEFVMAEQTILGRPNEKLTSLAGYAGGNAGAKNGKVCYHNAGSVSDYGSLGHAEVVRLKVPPSKFGAFAEEYFKLFDKNGERPDQFGDRGLEYRNLVGVPGGKDSPLAKELVQASIRQGDKMDFAKGKGDDPDSKALVFVMDTAAHPFYVGEAYHQFHDGFAWGENYPNSYNSLTNVVAKAGALPKSDCPNGALGLGIAGL